MKQLSDYLWTKRVATVYGLLGVIFGINYVIDEHHLFGAESLGARAYALASLIAISAHSAMLLWAFGAFRCTRSTLITFVISAGAYAVFVVIAVLVLVGNKSIDRDHARGIVAVGFGFNAQILTGFPVWLHWLLGPNGSGK